MRYIDLRSDTVTMPGDCMRRVMYEAEVGDDVYGEDPTVTKLEETAAELTGKEAALFVTSGTQGNLVALLTHCPRGSEVIMESEAHIFMYEVGGLAALGGLVPVRVNGHRGVLAAADVKANIRGENIHYPETGLICLENTHNRAGGTVVSAEQTRAVAEVAHAHNIPVHVDGARIVNAAVALGVPVSKLTEPVDTVNVCLSKGLGAPVGSVLCGPREFIGRARKYRKMVGGGLRQAGVIAAAGLHALLHNVGRLAEDHANAHFLAEGLNNIPGIKVDMDIVQTNIILADIAGTGYSTSEFVDRMMGQGIKAGAFGPTVIRFVTHLDVTRDDCADALQRLKVAASR